MRSVAAFLFPVLTWSGILLHGTLHAQGAGFPPGGGPMNIPTPKLESLAGVLYLESETVAKKIKFEASNTDKARFEEAFDRYAMSLDSLLAANQSKIDSINLVLEESKKKAEETFDFGQFADKLKQGNAAAEPLRQEIKVLETKLDTLLIQLLDPKHYQKWQEYFLKEKKALMPRMPMPPGMIAFSRPRAVHYESRVS